MATYRAGFMHAEVDGYYSNYHKRSTVLLHCCLLSYSLILAIAVISITNSMQTVHVACLHAAFHTLLLLGVPAKEL